MSTVSWLIGRYVQSVVFCCSDGEHQTKNTWSLKKKKIWVNIDYSLCQCQGVSGCFTRSMFLTRYAVRRGIYTNTGNARNARAGWETKIFWHSPKLGSLLYSLYKIPLAQACFPLARPNFHSHCERVSASFPACGVDPAHGLRSGSVCRNCVVLFTPPQVCAFSPGPLRAPADIAHGAVFLWDPQE